MIVSSYYFYKPQFGFWILLLKSTCTSARNALIDKEKPSSKTHLKLTPSTFFSPLSRLTLGVPMP